MQTVPSALTSPRLRTRHASDTVPLRHFAWEPAKAISWMSDEDCLALQWHGVQPHVHHFRDIEAANHHRTRRARRKCPRRDCLAPRVVGLAHARTLPHATHLQSVRSGATFQRKTSRQKWVGLWHWNFRDIPTSCVARSEGASSGTSPTELNDLTIQY